jgi:hypothetical protein
MVGWQCLPSDGFSLSQTINSKRLVRKWEKKCQRNEISPETSTDFYNAVSGDCMFPAVVTWGSFTRL